VHHVSTSYLVLSLVEPVSTQERWIARGRRERRGWEWRWCSARCSERRCPVHAAEPELRVRRGHAARSQIFSSRRRVQLLHAFYPQSRITRWASSGCTASLQQDTAECEQHDRVRPLAPGSTGVAGKRHSQQQGPAAETCALIPVRHLKPLHHSAMPAWRTRRQSIHGTTRSRTPLTTSIRAMVSTH
jgi:hypothetical protein